MIWILTSLKGASSDLKSFSQLYRLHKKKVLETSNLIANKKGIAEDADGERKVDETGEYHQIGFDCAICSILDPYRGP